MNKVILVLCLLIPVGTILFVAAPAASAQPAASEVEAIDRLFKASGNEYARIGEKKDVFVVQAGSSSFYFSGGSGNLIGFSIIAKKENFKRTVDSLAACLTQNGNMDFMKLFLDDEGALAIRFERPLDSLGEKEFKFLVGQLIGAEAESREKLKAYLTK
ncbi:MAG: hypothetical protein JO314_00995 [Acidobacteria bacterium]|nr:hypothetical protein [Acidobacteriota bacterium]